MAGTLDLILNAATDGQAGAIQAKLEEAERAFKVTVIASVVGAIMSTLAVMLVLAKD